MTPSPENPKRLGFSVGIGAVVMCNLILGLGAALANVGLLMLIGIVQLAYVIPIVIIALVQGETKFAQGALTAAGLTFLLNGLYCAGMLGAFGHV